MIIEKLISKWHASVDLLVWQMGIVRATLIHPGRLTSTPSAIKKLWAAKWTWHSVLHDADMFFFFFFFLGREYVKKNDFSLIILKMCSRGNEIETQCEIWMSNAN